MRIILVLIIIAGACGFFGFHKYTEKRQRILVNQLERERERYEELNKNLMILQQKLLLESMKNSELGPKLIQETPKADDSARKSQEEQERQKRLQLIAAKEKMLQDLKEKLLKTASVPGAALIDTSAIEQKISNTKSKINAREVLIKKAAALVGDKKFACFDSCINGTDIKFERKMTRTCRSVVSGGMYFCEHYDMLGTDYCTRHLHYHRNWKFPNRYRDDHRTDVRYWCRTHNVVWDKQAKSVFLTNHQHSRAILGNRMKYIQEVNSLKKNLLYFERVYNVAMAKNKSIKMNNERNTETVENQKKLLEKQIFSIEQEIAALKAVSAAAE